MRPRIYFERGWWRIRPTDRKWKHLSDQERDLYKAAYDTLNELNWTTFAVDMRNAHYARRTASWIKRAEQALALRPTEQEQATRGKQ